MGKATTDRGRFMQGRRPPARKPRPIGRVTKLTPEVHKKIIDAVRAGNHVNIAAQYAGVGVATLHEWTLRGRGEHPTLAWAKHFSDFTDDLDEARAAAEVAAVLHWRSAMPKDWHAAKDYLRVTAPERWDPDKDKNGPIAAVQVNIGGTTAQGQTAPTETPLVDLIEHSPAFLKAVMPLFDAVDAAYGPNTPQQPIDPSYSTSNLEDAVRDAPNPPNNTQMLQSGPELTSDAVFDPDTGSWRVIEGETSQNDNFDGKNDS